jgi:hypothetical protein
MASIDLPKSPNVFHPEKPSAVGSRNSLAQEARDQQAEVDLLLGEEVDKIVNHVSSKLPEEVLERLDVMGGIKEKLYNYFNQNYQNMFNRLMVTTEDEMVKKVRTFIDKEEMKGLARYTPREIAMLLDTIGGIDKFNTGEIEKSVINMYGHLQGHIQRGVNDLENNTNSLLRQKTDTGAFIRGENAYSIVKCSFKDNGHKPKTVTDVKLSVNILDSELISPIFHYQVTVEYLVKDLLSKLAIDSIDHEIEKMKDEVVDQGKEELADSEILFEKINRVEQHTSDDQDDGKGKRYAVVAKDLLDRIEGLRAEISPEEFDALNIRENIKNIVDIENIRNRGFNTAINSITSILDTSKMGYQYVENLKNARELVLREYEDLDSASLPDERYSIRLKYYDNAQLIEEGKSFDVQAKSLEVEVQHLYDVMETVYEGTKLRWGMFKNVVDFHDLAGKLRSAMRRRIARSQHVDTKDYGYRGRPDWSDQPNYYEAFNKAWDEISFVKPADTEVERLNRTHVYEKDKIKRKLIMIRDRMLQMYEYRYPIERRVMEERLQFLEKAFDMFDYMINPYHLQPGLLLDVDITSIKRKKATLDGMAGVLNEFLSGVSKGFQDAAFASFSRRRSTVREDIAQSFGEEPERASAVEQDAGSGTDDRLRNLLGNDEATPEDSGGVVDREPRKRRGGRSRGGEDSGLKEI